MLHRGQIDCTQCGNCCSTACEAKDDNLCKIHPARREDGADERPPICKKDTVTLAVQYGFACPPIGKVITELTGKELEVTEEHQIYPGSRSDGLPGCKYFEIIDLKWALEQEVTNSSSGMIELPVVSNT